MKKIYILTVLIYIANICSLSLIIKLTRQSRLPWSSSYKLNRLNIIFRWRLHFWIILFWCNNIVFCFLKLGNCIDAYNGVSMGLNIVFRLNSIATRSRNQEKILYVILSLSVWRKLCRKPVVTFVSNITYASALQCNFRDHFYTEDRHCVTN